jgi:hypothetical protein
MGGAQERVIVIGAVAFGLFAFGGVLPIEVLLLAPAVDIFLPVPSK